MGHLVKLQQNLRRGCIAALAFVMAFAFAVCIPSAQSASAANLPALGKGEVRIHVLPFDSTDAIIVECDGRFGMVDSAEDSASPDGSDFAYPNRPGITKGWGREAEVIAYMKKIGVNQSNLDFYIGTHPHSDHIGTAPQIIKEFHPKTIYTPVYEDSFITNPAFLWDNLYVYDRLLAAVEWAQSDQGYGARFIQHLDPNYKEPQKPTESGEGNDKNSEETTDSNESKDDGSDRDTDEGSKDDGADDSDDEGNDTDLSKENTGSPVFNLGSATIEIFNYDEAYQTTKVPDANHFCYGVKVTASNGRTAFLAGDINNYTDGDNAVGDEDRLAAVLGKIDLLKMGHHGHGGSNTPAYLRAILKNASSGECSVAVQTGVFANMSAETVATLNDLGAKHYQAASALERGQDAFVADLVAAGVRTNADGDQRIIVQIANVAPYASLYRNGLPYAGTGWYEGSDKELYYFGEAGSTGSSTALTDCWATYNGKRVYVNSAGHMNSEWGMIDSKWYLFDASGSMLHGWQKVNGAWYYLEADGSMATGWKKIGATWYYLDENSGAMKTGWYVVNGVPYYSQPNGAMVSGNGWKKLDGYWGFVTPSGAFKTHWLKNAGKWYYLRDTGKMATGWVEVGDVWYYLDGSGAMKTGWQKSGGKWYYLSGSGAMRTGWQKSGGSWYYLEDSGAMKTGWVEVEGFWYYLDGSGAMKTGWQKSGGSWYYLSGSGAMKTGWQKIGGKWYYLKDSGAMVTGSYRIDGTSYRFNSSGALV